jgi:hypothetical protein
MFARFTEQREARCLASRRGERRIAQATSSTACQHVARPCSDQIGQDPPVLNTIVLVTAARFPDDGAVGNGNHDIRTGGAVAIRTLARLARSSPLMGTVMEGKKGGDAGIDDDDHVSAAAPVTTIGTTERFELLPMHRGATIATIAGVGMDDDAINERGHGRRGVTKADRGRSGFGNDTDDATTAGSAEFHAAGAEREKRVIATAADIQARMEVRASLAHDDLTGSYELTAEALDAQTLRIGVTTVPGARCTLLMRHEITSQP